METNKPKLKEQTFYNQRVFLNDPMSPSTGSLVAYDGIRVIDKEEDRYTFLEISDCHSKIRLHKRWEEPVDRFIEKLYRMRTELDAFINHLEQKKRLDETRTDDK